MSEEAAVKEQGKSSVPPKKSVVNKTTVIGAILTVVITVASCPGFLTWLENAGERGPADDVANIAEALEKADIAEPSPQIIGLPSSLDQAWEKSNQ